MVSKAVAKREPGKALARTTKVDKARAARLAAGTTKMVKASQLRNGQTLQGFGGQATFVHAERGPWGYLDLRMTGGWGFCERPEAQLEVLS